MPNLITNKDGDAQQSLLFVVMTTNSTSAPFNEHVLPRRSDYEVAVCTFHTPVVEVPPGITVFDGRGSVFGFISAVRQALRSQRWGVIHGHAPIPMFLVLIYIAFTFIANRGFLNRTVYTVHSSIWLYPLKYRLILFPIFLSVASVVFCSRSSKESCPGWLGFAYGKRGSFIRNGVDLQRLEKSCPASPDAPNYTQEALNLIWIGRLIPLKRPLDVVACLAQLPSNVTLTIVGDGPLSEPVQKQIEEFRLQTRVELTGVIQREEVYARISKSDCLIATSIGEGMPISVLEAMASGRLVVLSDIPSHRELRELCDDVKLFPVGNVDLLVAEVEQIRKANSSERRGSSRRLMQITNSHFSLDDMHAQYDRTYRDLSTSDSGSFNKNVNA